MTGAAGGGEKKNSPLFHLQKVANNNENNTTRKFTSFFTFAFHILFHFRFHLRAKHFSPPWMSFSRPGIEIHLLSIFFTSMHGGDAHPRICFLLLRADPGAGRRPLAANPRCRLGARRHPVAVGRANARRRLPPASALETLSVKQTRGHQPLDGRPVATLNRRTIRHFFVYTYHKFLTTSIPDYGFRVRPTSPLH